MVNILETIDEQERLQTSIAEETSRKSINPALLRAGDIVEFKYNGRLRWGTVIASGYKPGLADMYVFDKKEDMFFRKELLNEAKRGVSNGALWATFGKSFVIKSFTISKISSCDLLNIKIGEEPSKKTQVNNK
ncbi:MAG: hypothetical protein VW683_11580 [Betaproteobacteria bacterium]|jgi:hypothetical protein